MLRHLQAVAALITLREVAVLPAPDFTVSSECFAAVGGKHPPLRLSLCLLFRSEPLSMDFLNDSWHSHIADPVCEACSTSF